MDPAQPPINIRIKKNINENFPHKPKSSVTYPVPDKIETTLKEEILNLSKIELSWLMKNKYELLGQMAMAADNDEQAMRWIHLNTSKEIFLIAQKIQFVKNRIDADNQDAHRFSKD